METEILTLVVTLISFALGFVVAPYLNKKGIVSDKSLEIGKQVLEVTGVAVRYIEQTAKHEDNKIKKELAKKSAVEALEAINIEVTDETLKLIEIGIEGAVNALPKTKPDYVSFNIK